MEISIKTDLNIQDIADALANSDDNKQAEFFNVFFKSLDLACGSEYKTQLQLSSIEAQLSERSKERLKFFYDDEA